MSMQSILAASQSMTKMQTIQSVRTQMQGKANVLRIESKQDGGDEKKDAKANELEEKSSNLMGDLMGEVNNVNEVLKPDEDTKTEEVSKEETEEKTPKTDSVELSDSAIKHNSEGTQAKPAVLEAVTYNSDGSTKSSTPAKATPTLEVMA